MIHKIEFQAMGSRIMAALESDETESLILKKVPTWFSGWEYTFSRFLPDSELSRLNRNAGKPFPVSRELFVVIKHALKAKSESGGLVTPFVVDSLSSIGYSTSFDQISANIDPVLVFSNLDSEELTLSERDQTVTLGKGTRIDLGGIAKGWAAHQAMLRLRKFGSCLVNAGGDIAISGPFANGTVWPVGISDPFQQKPYLTLLGLSDSSVATSGRDYRTWWFNGTWQHHLIDPRTHAPSKSDVLTATVVAPTVMQAEFAAKTAFLLGSKDGFDWLSAQKNHSGMLVLADGKQKVTPNFRKNLWKTQLNH